MTFGSKYLGCGKQWDKTLCRKNILTHLWLWKTGTEKLNLQCNFFKNRTSLYLCNKTALYLKKIKLASDMEKVTYKKLD